MKKLSPDICQPEHNFLPTIDKYECPQNEIKNDASPKNWEDRVLANMKRMYESEQYRLEIAANLS